MADQLGFSSIEIPGVPFELLNFRKDRGTVAILSMQVVEPNPMILEEDEREYRRKSC